MKLGRAGVFGVTQIFLMDGGGLEAGTELVEGVRFFLVIGEGVLREHGVADLVVAVFLGDGGGMLLVLALLFCWIFLFM